MFGVNPFGWPYFAQGPAMQQSGTTPTVAGISTMPTILGQNLSIAQPTVSPIIGTAGMSTP